MTSVRFLSKAASVLLLVVVAQLALLQHATRVEAGTLSHLDYVAKKGETKADKRGAKLPTVKKALDTETEEVEAVELEPIDEEDGDQDDNGTSPRPTQKSRSSLGAWWSTTRWPRSRAASLGEKVVKESEEDNEDNIVDPLDHEGKSGAKSESKKGSSRSDLDRFDVDEREEGEAPMIVLKIHPVESKKKSGGAKPTLSPSINKLVHDAEGKTGPNGTVVITIKPDLSLIAKLNKTGEIQGFGSTTMKSNATDISIETSSGSSSSSSSTIKITEDGSVVKTDDGTTTRIPTFKISTTQKAANNIVDWSVTRKPTTGKPTTRKPTTGKPTTRKPTTRKPSTGKPSTGKPTTGKPTTGKPTTGKPTTGKPTTGKPTTGKPTTGKPTTGKPTTGKPTTTKKPDNKLPTTKSPLEAACPCMTAKPKTTPKPTTANPNLKSTIKPASTTTSKKPASSPKPNNVTPKSTVVDGTGCTARPDCQCNYQELKDTDKMLAVVITNRGGFKGRRLNSKAIAQIMAGKISTEDMKALQAQKSITVNSNNTYVLPAGQYYFPHPIRVAGFTSP